METVSNISTRKELYCQFSILSVDYTIGFKNKWRLYSGNTGVLGAPSGQSCAALKNFRIQTLLWLKMEQKMIIWTVSRKVIRT